MSTWRRSALQVLPRHRARLERASTPEDLWRVLVALLETDGAESLTSDEATAVFRYAAACLSSPSEGVSRAVRELFYPYALTRRSTQLCLFVRESEWFGLEAAMRPLLPSEQLTAARQDFFRGLAELDDPSPVTTLRRIKNGILATVAAPEKTSVERAWEQAVQLLEVGERALGLEIFLGNLDDADLRIDPGVRKILEDLAAQWGATLP